MMPSPYSNDTASETSSADTDIPSEFTQAEWADHAARYGNEARYIDKMGFRITWATGKKPELPDWSFEGIACALDVADKGYYDWNDPYTIGREGFNRIIVDKLLKRKKPALDESCQFTLILDVGRHCECSNGADGVRNGLIPAPLDPDCTDHGYKTMEHQAEQLKAKFESGELKPDVVIASVLRRAINSGRFTVRKGAEKAGVSIPATLVMLGLREGFNKSGCKGSWGFTSDDGNETTALPKNHVPLDFDPLAPDPWLECRAESETTENNEKLARGAAILNFLTTAAAHTLSTKLSQGKNQTGSSDPRVSFFMTCHSNISRQLLKSMPRPTDGSSGPIPTDEAQMKLKYLQVAKVELTVAYDEEQQGWRAKEVKEFNPEWVKLPDEMQNPRKFKGSHD